MYILKKCEFFKNIFFLITYKPNKSFIWLKQMYLSLFDNVNEKFFLFIIRLVLTMLLQKVVNKNKIKLFSVKKSFSNNKKVSLKQTINIRFNMKTLCSVFLLHASFVLVLLRAYCGTLFIWLVTSNMSMKVTRLFLLFGCLLLLLFILKASFLVNYPGKI